VSNPTFRPRLNHVAISVDPALLDELHAIVGRAKTYGERDDRVRVVDVHERTTELQHLASVPRSPPP
jgi:hypothetical protein